MNKTIARVKVSKLELVYPPISNQEAVWLQDVPEVQEELRASDFYMIGGRREAKLTDLRADAETHVLRFNLCVGDDLCDPVSLHLRDIPGVAGHDSYWLEAGEKMVRLWDGPVREEGSDVLNWFTTEKLLFDRAHEVPGIEGLPRCLDLATYDLLYVGIARKGDSFDRLIARGHKARMDILASEPQRYPGARVTDEIYLFFFQVNPLVIQTFDPGHKFTGDEFSGELDRKRIVADAEKAFVSLLRPEYNVVTFSSYPSGADGLFGAGYDRYGYLIGETMAFNTAHGRIKGACDPRGSFSNNADFIFVEGEKASFFVSGIDFPGSV
jgi:hypothetical protein